MDRGTSRVNKSIKNAFFGIMATGISTILKFITRTIFIYTIGVQYLGISGLFSSILMVLSFVDLGIGTAINYSLYKPAAQNDLKKINTLMHLFRKAYIIIALVVLCLGLSVIPFLNYLINDVTIASIEQIRIYFLCYLGITVSSYFISYKYSLLFAYQKNYIFSNIQSITSIVMLVFQIIVLLIYKNFLFYLIVALVVEIIQKFVVSGYLNKKYPVLLEKKCEKLSPKEFSTIRKNISSLVIHRIGDIAALQTDNILISVYMNTSTVGIVSNYVLIITTIGIFIDIVVNSIASSIGNVHCHEKVGHIPLPF